MNIKVESVLNKAITQTNLRVVDLSHSINIKTPTFSKETNSFHYELLSSVEKDGFMSGAFRILEHFGTHMDAPAHFVSGKATIEQVPASQLVLPAIVIDVQKETETNADYQLTIEKIEEFEREGQIPDKSAVLLFTGWDQYYSIPARYRNEDEQNRMHFPGYSAEAARYLVEKRGVYILGIDTLSVDPGSSETYPVHQVTLSKDVCLIENLTNLSQLPSRGSLLFCGPLAIEGGSGSPARILAAVL